MSSAKTMTVKGFHLLPLLYPQAVSIPYPTAKTFLLNMLTVNKSCMKGVSRR